MRRESTGRSGAITVAGQVRHPEQFNIVCLGIAVGK